MGECGWLQRSNLGICKLIKSNKKQYLSYFAVICLRSPNMLILSLLFILPLAVYSLDPVQQTFSNPATENVEGFFSKSGHTNNWVLDGLF